MLILVEFIEDTDSLSRFSSKSLSVIGRLIWCDDAAVSIAVRSLRISGLDGVVIIEDDANGTRRQNTLINYWRIKEPYRDHILKNYITHI